MLKYLERGGIPDSFSLLHTLAYSVIALQELNLNYRYNPLYWNTACLTVNSGGIEDKDDETLEEGEEQNKKKRSTNYGKVASAIGNIMRRGVKVTLPDINKADFKFKPDIDNGSIIFGMKGMLGIGDDLIHLITENRPYISFDDFVERMFKTGLVKKGQVTQLIKGGSFDSIGDRIEIMKSFAATVSEPKEKLTMANMNMLVENNLIPDNFSLEVRFFKFKDYISKRVYKNIPKPKDRLFILNDIASQFFSQHFTDESVADYDNGSLIISEKKFKKEYDKKMESLKNWIQSPEALRLLNDKLSHNEFLNMASGSVSKWEMDSLSFYYTEHELKELNTEKYGISNFFELPEEPVKGKPYMWRGREMYEFETTRIAGTVLDKNKTKRTVTLLTLEGVVTVKMYGGAFGHYDKQISQSVGDKKKVIEKSWFTRGNKLLVSGFRRSNNFIPKVYKNSIYRHTIALIDDLDSEGNLILTTERTQL